MSCSALLSPRVQRCPLLAAPPPSETLSTGNYSCCVRGHFALISPPQKPVVPSDCSETERTRRILVSPLKALFPKQPRRQQKPKPVTKLISMVWSQGCSTAKTVSSSGESINNPFGGLFQAVNKSSISTGKVTTH